MRAAKGVVALATSPSYWICIGGSASTTTSLAWNVSMVSGLSLKLPSWSMARAKSAGKSPNAFSAFSTTMSSMPSRGLFLFVTEMSN